MRIRLFSFNLLLKTKNLIKTKVECCLRGAVGQPSTSGCGHVRVSDICHYRADDRGVQYSKEGGDYGWFDFCFEFCQR